MPYAQSERAFDLLHHEGRQAPLVPEAVAVEEGGADRPAQDQRPHVLTQVPLRLGVVVGGEGLGPVRRWGLGGYGSRADKDRGQKDGNVMTESADGRGHGALFRLSGSGALRTG